MTVTSTGASWPDLAGRLSRALRLSVPPIFMSFTARRPEGVRQFDAPMSEPAADGRRGRVPASCVFWVEGAREEGGFSTEAEDHGNCSVGRLTHGFASLEEVEGNDDVAALLSSGWVTPDMIPSIPSVSERPGAIAYGKLEAVPPGVSPDVIMLRVNGRQLMVLADSIPGLHIGGKPQCHIVAIAKEGAPAVSVGCAISRARTGMRPDEMTCALPAAGLEKVVDAIERTAAADTVVARYAVDDARRFG